MKIETYTRSNYPSRGHRPDRDEAYNTVVEFVKARCCAICNERLERKTLVNGELEQWSNFFRRKTCGYIRDDDGKLKRSECLYKRFLAEGNQNYKGFMPKCKVCGKKIGYRERSQGGYEFCGKHFRQHARKTGIFKSSGQRLLDSGYGWKKGQKCSGIGFKKGQVSYSKGKSFEEAFGKRAAKRMKADLSLSMKEKWKDGRVDVRKPKVSIRCIVCNKKIKLTPYRAKIQKTCSLSCNGKVKTLKNIK